MTPSEVTRLTTWKPLPPPFSKYEWRVGGGSGPDQRPIRRAGAMTGLATTVSNHGGYLMVKPYDDDGKRQTRTVHSLILLGAVGPCPAGLESRHLDDDPLNNRWAPGGTDDEVRANGGNLIYGTKKQNTADQYRNGGRNVAPPPPPPRPCVRCGGLFTAKGRRCPPCVTAVGQQAAARLRAGMNLEVVTRKAGYQGRSQEWVHELARRHGGYAGPLEGAQAQGRRWSQRATATLRYGLRLGRR